MLDRKVNLLLQVFYEGRKGWKKNLCQLLLYYLSSLRYSYAECNHYDPVNINKETKKNKEKQQLPLIPRGSIIDITSISQLVN
jgi:hypothetical protein